MTKKQFDLSGLKEILADNKKAMIERIYGEAMQRALKVKYGSRVGLLCLNPVTDEEYKSVSEDMASVISAINAEATMSFARVFEGILEDKGCREYLLSKTASITGKKNIGSRAGTREKHLEWLEAVMIANEKKSITLTAEDHFEEIRSHHYVDADLDDDKLFFTRQSLENMGYDPDRDAPSITIHVIRKVLTKINKAKKRDAAAQ